MKKLIGILFLCIFLSSCATSLVQQRNEKAIARFKANPMKINPMDIQLIPFDHPDDNSFFWLHGKRF